MKKNLKNIFLLINSSVLSQAIGALLIPILTRCYGPAEYGMYALYLASLALLTGVATGRYEFAIPIPKENNESKDILFLIIFCSLFLSFLIVILFYILSFFIFYLNKLQIYFIPLGFSIAFLGINTGLYQWTIRIGHFKTLGIMQLLQTTCIAGFQIILYFCFGNHSLNMIIGHTLALIFTFFYYIFALDFKINFSLFSLKKLKKNALLYIDNPKYYIFAQTIDNLAPQLPIYYLAAFNPILLGLFSLSRRVLGIPISVIGNAVSKVFYSQAAEKLRNKESIFELYKYNLKILFSISVLVFFVTLIIDENLYIYILGEKWKGFKNVMILLLPLYFMQLIVTPLATTLVLFKKYKIDLLINISVFFACCFGIFIGHIFKLGQFLLLSYSLSYAAFYIFYIIIIHKLARQTRKY
jgi:O-antigen/teichoic acid export membrane protein